MKVTVTSNTFSSATIGGNKVLSDRVIASAGGVNSVGTGYGLTGGPITSVGTISANVANTTQPGVVQLNDTLTSTSITQAATANAVNSVHTIASNALSIASNSSDNANLKLNIAGGTITGSLNISGNLLVTGNSTTLNVETLVVKDNQIILNSGEVGTPTLNAEIIVNRGDSTNVFLRWDEIGNHWGWSDIDQNFYPFDIARDAYDKANVAYTIASYASSNANNRVLKSGDTMTGDLIVLTNVTANNVNVSNTINFDGGSYIVRGQGGSGNINVVAGTNGSAKLQSADANSYIWANNSGVYIGTNTSVNAKQWAFSNTGGLVFPDSTTQTTAYTWAQISPVYNQANAAYNQANTATSIAQNAYSAANSAAATAGVAVINAGLAYGQANAAYTQANSAYAQANLAYAAANNAAVKVTANSGLSFSANTLSFNNTATVSVVVEQNGSNANVSFVAAPQVIVNDTYAAQGNVTAAATANIANGLYGIATSAYNQANLAYAAANNSNLKAGGLISGTLNVSSDLIVGGNLYLSGNTTYINVSTYQVNDSLLYIAANNYLTDTVDIGFIGAKNTAGVYSHTGLARHAQDGIYYLFDNLAEEGHVNNVIDVANTTYATLRANIDAKSIVLNGNAVATNVQVSAAYNQANLAYAAANNAAVRVTANTGSTISANVISFNNSSSISVSVTGAGSNANVTFASTNAVSSKFTSDGVTNVYSLSSSVSNVNNILVSIDGVVILPTSDYTVSGSSLTLTFMPPGGLNIEARTLR